MTNLSNLILFSGVNTVGGLKNRGATQLIVTCLLLET